MGGPEGAERQLGSDRRRKVQRRHERRMGGGGDGGDEEAPGEEKENWSCARCVLSCYVLWRCDWRYVAHPAIAPRVVAMCVVLLTACFVIVCVCVCWAVDFD